MTEAVVYVFEKDLPRGLWPSFGGKKVVGDTYAAVPRFVRNLVNAGILIRKDEYDERERERVKLEKDAQNKKTKLQSAEA